MLGGGPTLSPPPRPVSRTRGHIEALVDHLDANLRLADGDDLPVERGVHLSDLTCVLQEDSHSPASTAMKLETANLSTFSGMES